MQWGTRRVLPVALLAAIILNPQPSALPRAGAASAGGVLQLRALGGGGVTVGRLILRGGEGEEVGGENKPSGPRIVRYTSADRPWGQPCEEEIYDNADMTSVCQHVATEQNGKAYGHCMECEVMAFLQRAAAIIEDNGGKMNSTEFAWMWTETYPGDPLTKEQVTTAVAGILKDSGYFMVTETSQRFVKMFELLELDENQEVGDTIPAMCLPYYDPPVRQDDDFIENSRRWLRMTGVGCHPAVGSGNMTNMELTEKIVSQQPLTSQPRHDEVVYDGRYRDLVGYWTLGACKGSNGCIHKNKVEKGGPEKAHWTCCGSMDITSVFCDVQS